MSGATFSRLKNWTIEVLSNTDLNAEIDNILSHLDPTGVGDYSDTVPEMKIQTSPGALGTESLATSLAGELERLRFVIAEITGNQYWYQAPANSISALVASLGGGLPPNRIITGRTTGNSSQLCALIPAGSTASVTLTASSITPFQYAINGSAYTITASVNIALALVSSTAATAQVSIIDPGGTALANYGQSKGIGMYNTIFSLQSASATFGNFVGQICGFQITNGVGGLSEYAVGYVQSTSQITNMWRGSFFDQSANHVPQVDLVGGTVATTSVVTLMKLSWLFANTAGSLAVTYNNPAVSAIQPGSANTGDYWFDLTTTAWKTFNSTTWMQANATLIGMSMQNTANCVAARTFDSYVLASSLNEMPLTQASTTSITAENWFGKVQVFGTSNNFGPSRPNWTQPGSLDAGVVMSASTTYFMYMKENGTPVISNQFPINRRDLNGLYHNYETWRALGVINTDSNTAFVASSLKSFIGSANNMLVLDPNFYGTTGYVSSTISLTSTNNNFFTQRFPVNTVFSYTVATAGNTYGDIATFSLTPGLYALSGTCVSFPASGFPDFAPFNFGFGATAGASNAGLLTGYNLAIGSTGGLGGALTSLALTVSSTTGAITSTGSFVSSRPAIPAIIPKYVVNVGINQTTFYVKASVNNTGSGVWGFQGVFMAERLDLNTGTPV